MSVLIKIHFTKKIQNPTFFTIFACIVLSAAHCFANENTGEPESTNGIFIVAGIHDLGKNSGEQVCIELLKTISDKLTLTVVLIWGA